MSKLPPLSAPLIASVGGALRSRGGIRRGNVGTRIFGGRMGTISNVSQQTYQVTLSTELKYDAIRVIFANSQTSAYDIGGCKIVGVPDESDINMSSIGGFTQVTFSGINTATCAAALSTSRRAFLLSDFITVPSVARTDGGAFPLLTIRAYISTSTATLSVVGAGDNFLNWATRPDGRRWIMRYQPADFVTGTSGFSSTTNRNQCPIVGIQYIARGRVVSVVGFGDSITEGRSTYLGEGWGFPACAELSSAGLGCAFEWSDLGWSGQNTTQIQQNGLDALLAFSEQPFDLAFIPNYSPNDYAASPTLAGVRAMGSKARRLGAEMRRYGTIPIYWTGLPTNAALYASGAADSYRQSLNAEFLAYPGDYVADFSAAVQNATPLGSGQYEFASGMVLGDNIHPSDAGNTSIKARAKTVIRTVADL